MHGFPDNVHLYDRVSPYLSPPRRVVLFDFLGWGSSDKPSGYPYSADNQVGDLNAVITQLGLGQVVLVLPTSPPISGESSLRPKVHSGRLERNKSRSAHGRKEKMIRRCRIAPLLLLPLLVAGCSSSESKLEPIASKLQEAVNRCRADVLDRGTKYEDSTHCRSLGAIAKQYVAAGGFTDKTSCPADRIAETARARAWMALAVSRTGDKGLAVW